MKRITVLIGFIFLLGTNILSAQSNVKSDAMEADGVGLVDVEEHIGFSVYPSPAKNDINVQFEIEKATTIRMGNILGNMLYETTTTSNTRLYSTTLDISSLPKGLYFITIDDGVNAQTKRFVKQ